MNGSLRIWTMVAAAGTVAVLAGGWFLGVSPALAAAETADLSTATVESQDQVLQAKLAELSKAAAKTEELTAQAAVLAKSMPETLKPNTFVRRINTVAALNGVSVQSVTFGAAQAYTAPASAQAAAVPATTDGTEAATPAPTASVTEAAAPAAAAGPALAATDPAITAANFTVVPMTVAVKGTPGAVLEFTEDIAQDERTFLVSGYATAEADTVTGAVTATLTGYIYTLVS